MTRQRTPGREASPAGRILRRFIRDERGATTAEYVIVLTYMVVAFIFVNRFMDTLLFGASPWTTPSRPTTVDPDALRLPGYEEEFLGNKAYEEMALHSEEYRILQQISSSPEQDASDPDKAYLSQLYIHLARP